MSNTNKLNSLKVLLNNDTSPDKPKIIEKNNKFTKKFLEWNRKVVRQGLTNYYADESKIYNPSTKKFINIQTDKRYKNKKVPKKTFVDKLLSQNTDFNYFDKQLIPKSNTIIETITNQNEIGEEWLLRSLVKKNKLVGQYRIIIKINGNIVKDGIEKLTSNYNKWWDSVRTSDYRTGSQEFIWQLKNSSGQFDSPKFIFSKDIGLSQTYFKQYYRDGVSHCFFTPIIKWCNDNIEMSKSSSSSKKYESIKNKIIGKTLKTGEVKENYLKKYEKGISADDIPSICEDLQIGVEITQPFNTNTFLRYISKKLPLKVFKFINTRLNHLDINQDSINTLFTNDYKNIEFVDRNTLINIKERLTKNKDFFVFTKDYYGINSIKTLNIHYSLQNDFIETINKFEIEYGLDDTKLDPLLFPEVQKFINNGCHWNGTIDFKDVKKYNVNDVSHIDETKAYTQFKNCKYYNGFLGGINNFRKVDNYKMKGYYYITDLDLSKCSNKFNFYNDNLKWFVNNNIYTDSELNFLNDQNGKFKVIMGAYGRKIDFEFKGDMLDKKEVIKIGIKEIPIPYYSKWVGLSGSIRECNNIYMSGDKKYFETIKSKGYDMYYNDYDNEARISYKKMKLSNNRHIAGQITAYQRLNLIDQLMNMEESKIIRVCVDGIYYEPHECKINNTFGPKGRKTFENSACSEYLSHLLNTDNDVYKLTDNNEAKEFYQKELHTGVGGGGKTHNILIDKGLINVGYFAVSWKLSSNKVKEYEKQGATVFDNSVWYRALNKPHRDEIFKRFETFVFDECSMMTEYEKKFLFNEICVKRGKNIIMCGDLGYQLPPVIDKYLIDKARKDNDINIILEMNDSCFDYHQHYEKSFRCKCSKLENISIQLRKMIKSCRDSFYQKFDKINESEKLNYYIENAINSNYDKFYNNIKDSLNLQKINTDQLKNKYIKEDMILVSERELREKYNTMFSHIEKYMVDGNYQNYCNGEIIYSKPEKIGVEFRHAYTVHSIQGETANNNLYIDFTKFKSIRMLYTAISRAKYYNQIFEIVN
jgi:hypothetical protein